MERRGFLKNAGIYASSLSLLPFYNTQGATMLDSKQESKELYQSTDWEKIAKEFEVPGRDFINLENGYYSPQPKEVLQEHLKAVEYVNATTARYMRLEFKPNLKKAKQAIANFSGIDPNDLVLTRNTTESLAYVIEGLSFENKEEVLLCNHDYPSAIQQYRHRERREGINMKMITLPAGASDDEIVALYEETIKSMKKPTYLHLTHMINFTGQVMPVQRLVALGRKYGMEIICDGAHSYAHINVKISDLDVDYYMCSLHKWLCCPFGGLLYIKPEKKAKLWALYGETSYPDDDIRKFERLGTIQPPAVYAIEKAIAFHERIGSDRKQERLNFLKNYWISNVKDLDRININTPLEEGRSCAIANFSIDGIHPTEVVNYLYDKYRIYTSSTDDMPVVGTRVTPHVYTYLSDLDKLIDGITRLAKS